MQERTPRPEDLDPIERAQNAPAATAADDGFDLVATRQHVAACKVRNRGSEQHRSRDSGHALDGTTLPRQAVDPVSACTHYAPNRKPLRGLVPRTKSAPRANN